MSKYSISVRGPYIWNNFLNLDEKQIITMYKFKGYTKIETAFSRGKTHIFVEETFSIHQTLRELNSLSVLI